MGEYATYRGEQVKIGTCEDFYYLRAEQRHLVSGYGFDDETLAVTRFRFPFPDEDDVEPGQFDDYGRGVKVPGYVLPSELSGDEHRSIQFRHDAGYLLSVRCPETYRSGADGSNGLRIFSTVDGEAVDEYETKIHRNGFSGQPVVVQQAYRFGLLVTLLHCGACGAVHRLDTLEDARPVIDAFRAEAERTEWRRTDVIFPPGDDYPKVGSYTDSPTYGDEPAHSESTRAFYRTIADRIEAGYLLDGPDAIRRRLEYLRGEIRAERISQGEIAELQGLAAYIEPGDVELLEWAGVPEFPDDDDPLAFDEGAECENAAAELGESC